MARTFQRVIAVKALNASEDEYLAAIVAALESDEALSELVPQSRPEETVRAYLTSMQKEIIRSYALAANDYRATPTAATRSV